MPNLNLSETAVNPLIKGLKTTKQPVTESGVQTDQKTRNRGLTVVSRIKTPESDINTTLLDSSQKTPNKHLTVYEKERYCALDLSGNALAIAKQRQTAKVLATHFAQGNEETPADQWKAKHYAILTNDALTKKEKQTKIAELNQWNLKRTQTWYALVGWINSTRLGLGRINRVMQLTGKIVLPRLFAIGGFINGIELIIDTGIILKHVFKPSEGQKNIPWYSRASSALTKDSRWYRMLNAIVWLSINITTFIMTGGLSAILNVCGFSFDPLNEMLLSYVEISRHNKLRDKLKNKRTYLDNELTRISNPYFTQYKQLLQEINSLKTDLAANESKIKLEKKPHILSQLIVLRNALESDLKHKNQEVKELIKSIRTADSEHNLFEKYIKVNLEISKLETTIKNLKVSRFHTVFVVVGVLAGMALFFFPPAGIPAIVGAVVALTIGSIMGGICKRIYDRRAIVANAMTNTWESIKSCFTSDATLKQKTNKTAMPRRKAQSTPDLRSSNETELTSPSDMRKRRNASAPCMNKLKKEPLSIIIEESNPDIEVELKSPHSAEEKKTSLATDTASPTSSNSSSTPPLTPTTPKLAIGRHTLFSTHANTETFESTLAPRDELPSYSS